MKYTLAQLRQGTGFASMAEFVDASAHAELKALAIELDAALRDIRAAHLDGSEPAIGELLEFSSWLLAN